MKYVRPTRAKAAGPDLATLLIAAFQSMIDQVTEDLARHGHPDVRASHEFAMRAILAGADSAVDLARSLSISRQGAAKTIAALEERGYVARESNPKDARRKHLVLTSRGHEMLALGGEILNGIHARWENLVGAESLKSLTRSLKVLTARSAEPLAATSWLEPR